MTQLYVVASVSMLVYYNSIRSRHYVTRSGILPTSASPWRHLYENGDEVSFLNLTGFSREAFEEMHQYQYENVGGRYSADRPRMKSRLSSIKKKRKLIMEMRLDAGLSQ